MRDASAEATQRIQGETSVPIYILALVLSRIPLARVYSWHNTMFELTSVSEQVKSSLQASVCKGVEVSLILCIFVWLFLIFFRF